MLNDDAGIIAGAQPPRVIATHGEISPVWTSLRAPQLLALTPQRVVEPVSWIGHAPFVMWLIEQWEPSQVVSLGVGSGNAFFAMCQAISSSGAASAIVGVDEWTQDLSGAVLDVADYESVSAHCEGTYGSFASLMRCSFDSALRSFSDGTVDLLHVDGCKEYDAVRHDYQAWLPKLSDHGVILLHGTQLREEGRTGASRLWAEIKRYYPHCEFAHSHGLGVLFVGRSMDARRTSLCDAVTKPSAAEPVHGLFASFGGLLSSERQASLKIDSVTADMKRLTRDIESRGSALARLQAILESVRAERDQAVERAARSEDLGAALAQSRAEHESLSRRLAEANAELLARDSYRAELLARVKECEAAICSRDAEIESRGSALARLQAILESARAERDQAMERAARSEDLGVALAQSRAEHESLSRRLAEANAELLVRCDQQVADVLQREQALRIEQRVSQALRAVVDERWCERTDLVTCRTWRLWQPVREILTRTIRRRKNVSIRLALSDAWAALLGRQPLDPPPPRDPLLDVRYPQGLE